MCGRANLNASAHEIEEAFHVQVSAPLSPRYNIAPSESILAVRAGAPGREVVSMRWGLIRSGSEDARPPINLQAERVAKGAMRSTFREHRCIVPFSGFYEWKREGKARQPFNVRRKDGELLG